MTSFTQTYTGYHYKYGVRITFKNRKIHCITFKNINILQKQINRDLHPNNPMRRDIAELEVHSKGTISHVATRWISHSVDTPDRVAKGIIAKGIVAECIIAERIIGTERAQRTQWTQRTQWRVWSHRTVIRCEQIRGSNRRRRGAHSGSRRNRKSHVITTKIQRHRDLTVFHSIIAVVVR